jgi:uncharacterized membrane protein
MLAMDYPMFLKSFWAKRIRDNRPLLELLYQFLLVYIALDAIILVWFTMAPVYAESDNRMLFGLSMLAYNQGYKLSNCHQMPQRTLFVGDYPMPFCARDYGLYLGCLIGALLPFTRLRLPKFLAHPLAAVAFMAPMAVDGVTQTILGLRESDNTLRVITGLLFGFGLVYMFAAWIVAATSSFIDAGKERKIAYRLFAVFTLTLLFLSHAGGDGYVRYSEAAGKISFTPSVKTYVSARAHQTIRFDPYAGSYDDPIMERLISERPRGNGFWVFFDGEKSGVGRHVYTGRTEGEIILIGDRPKAQ